MSVTNIDRATTLAQRQIKGLYSQPTYSLTFNDKDFASQLYNGTITYSADGTSDLALATDADLTQHSGEKVVIEIGYGEETWPYFGGWLEEPADDDWGGPATADAYGPFKELNEYSVQSDLTYAGNTLGYAISSLHNIPHIGGMTYEIVGNPTYLLTGTDAGVALATPIGDAIGNFLSLAGWVSQDRPRFIRRYRPQPRPRPSAEYVATYTEAHYGEGAFKAILNRRYGTAGAYYRDDNGVVQWVSTVVVDPAISALKTYWLTDFVGTQASALVELGPLASLLREGVYSWTLSGISGNPGLELFDVIRVWTTELRYTGGRFRDRFEVLYACAIDDTVSVDISRDGLPMSLSGKTAIKLQEKKLPSQFAVAMSGSAVVR